MEERKPVSFGKVFDIWSIFHFATWMIIIGNIHNIWPIAWFVAFGITLIGTVAWELIEINIEKLHPERFSVEPWSNRWVGDPICNLSGGMIGWYLMTLFHGS